MNKNLREAVKSALPDSILTRLRTVKHVTKLRSLYHSQATRFARESSMGDRSSAEQMAALLVFFSHRIEKGLTHSDFRPGFGTRTLVQLDGCLHQWVERGFPQDAFEFRVAVAALRAYRDRHVNSGFALPPEFERFADLSGLIDSADTSMSGAVEVMADDWSAGGSYDNTLRRRHSIREYAPGTVGRDLILEAVGIAMAAPSVCNRQSQRVVLVESPDKVEAILDAQGGWKGYAYPPALLVVTSSLPSFVSATERNEPYVDGGIFTMALLGALEWVGLAACPLNAMFEVSNELAIRKAARVPEGEVMVCIVTVGRRPKSILCPRSARKAADDVVRYA